MNQTTSKSVVRIPLVDDPCPARSARRATRQLTEALGLANAPDPGVIDAIDTAVLVASELVTNAWRHACGALEMRLHWNGKALTIEVDDASHVCPVVVADELRGASGGFGLGLVEQLTEAWGVDHQPFGKTVHARVACTSLEPAACGCTA